LDVTLSYSLHLCGEKTGISNQSQVTAFLGLFTQNLQLGQDGWSLLTYPVLGYQVNSSNPERTVGVSGKGMKRVSSQAPEISISYHITLNPLHCLSAEVSRSKLPSPEQLCF